MATSRRQRDDTTRRRGLGGEQCVRGGYTTTPREIRWPLSGSTANTRRVVVTTRTRMGVPGGIHSGDAAARQDYGGPCARCGGRACLGATGQRRYTPTRIFGVHDDFTVTV